MPRILKYFSIGLLAFLVMVPAASAQRRGVFFGGGFYGPGWGWYGPGWGWYSPYYGYGYGWGYPYAYSPAARNGEVKLVSVPKDALVYVDGGYAGTAGKLKKFRLSPGNHDIELRDPSGHAFHQERIHVTSGNTLEIHGNAGGH